MNDKEYEFYKPVRNLIRQYIKHDLLKAIVVDSYNISKIYDSGKNLEYLSQRGIPPHYLLLLGKWIILDWDNIKGKKPVSQNELIKIKNGVIYFADKVVQDTTPQDPILKTNKIMRQIAFQQFWYQQGANDEDVGRTIELLIKSSISDKTECIMYDYCGLNRIEFFDLLLTLKEALDGNAFIMKIYYKTMKIEKRKIDSFFKLLSINEDDFTDFNEKFSTKNPSEIYETSPFKLKPFLNIGEKYYLWSIAFLDEFIKFGIYDILKSSAKSEFSNCWGTIFENYLKKRLDEYNISYIPEKQLRKKGYARQVDFLIKHKSYFKSLFDKKSTLISFKQIIFSCMVTLKNIFRVKGLISKYDLILIEAKAIEAPHHTKFYPSDKRMIRAYKKDIIKALAQAHEVVKTFKVNKLINDTFLLIVTYKELYLGDGEDVWNEFAKTSLSNDYGIKNFNIKPENLFFIPINSFDRLLQITNGNIEQMIKIFKEVIKQSKGKTKKYIFETYLKEFDMVKSKDQYLVKIFEDYLTSMQQKYS